MNRTVLYIIAAIGVAFAVYVFMSTGTPEQLTKTFNPDSLTLGAAIDSGPRPDTTLEGYIEPPTPPDNYMHLVTEEGASFVLLFPDTTRVAGGPTIGQGHAVAMDAQGDTVSLQQVMQARRRLQVRGVSLAAESVLVSVVREIR